MHLYTPVFPQAYPCPLVHVYRELSNEIINKTRANYLLGGPCAGGRAGLGAVESWAWKDDGP